MNIDQVGPDSGTQWSNPPSPQTRAACRAQETVESKHTDRCIHDIHAVPVRDLAINCLLAPCCNYQNICNWVGPEILSPLTTAHDIFDHLSAILPYKSISWLEIHLLITGRWTSKLVTILPFFLSRTKPFVYSLDECQELIGNAIRTYQAEEPGGFHFDLILHAGGPNVGPHIATESIRPEETLDPRRFVENICGPWTDAALGL